jgi:hypothetical protein
MFTRMWRRTFCKQVAKFQRNLQRSHSGHKETKVEFANVPEKDADCLGTYFRCTKLVSFSLFVYFFYLTQKMTRAENVSRPGDGENSKLRSTETADTVSRDCVRWSVFVKWPHSVFSVFTCSVFSSVFTCKIMYHCAYIETCTGT